MADIDERLGWGEGGKLCRTGDVLCHVCQTTIAKKFKGKSKHWEKEEKEKKKKERKKQKHIKNTEKKKENPPHILDLTRQCSW